MGELLPANDNPLLKYNISDLDIANKANSNPLLKYNASDLANEDGASDIVSDIASFADDVKSAAYRVSGGIWHQAKNAAMLAQKVLPETVSEFASLPQAEAFSGEMETVAKQRVVDPATFAQKVNQGIVGGLLSLPEYALAGMAGPFGFAALGALEEVDKGPEAAAKAAIEGAAFGGILKAVSPLSRSAQVGTLAGVSGIQGQLAGKEPVDIIADMTTSAGLGVLQSKPGGKTFKEAIDEFRLDRLGNELNRIIDPMSTATDKDAMVAAKKLMNRHRIIDAWKNREFDKLTKEFTSDEITMMYTAQSEESLIRQGKLNDNRKGWNSLPKKQRDALEKRLQPIYQEAVAEAKKAGVLDDAFDVYDPRIVIETLSPGEISRLGSKTIAAGSNIRTSFGNLKSRKYSTLSETEQAIKDSFGEGASVLKDARVFPLVTAKLMKATESALLIEHIRQRGKEADVETVRLGGDPQGWFTNPENPAFYKKIPRIKHDEKGQVVIDGEGRVELVRTEDGSPVIDRVPLYIHPHFAGPLEAITTKPHSMGVQALLDLKYKGMSVIMFNPIVHNSVIYFKAMPYDPIGMLTFSDYRRGNQLLGDDAFVERAMKHNTVFMDRYGAQRDISDMAPEPGLSAGRSWTANVAGKIAKPFGREAQAREAIDKAGDFWHGRMLWKQVAKVQASLYEKTERELIKLGMEPDAAGYAAGHIANRYGGAIPYEDMGRSLRTAMNFILFSRSFTGTNIGIWKDALFGLSESTKAQIEYASNSLNVSIANSYIKKKQAEALVADIAASIVIGAGMQTTITAIMTDSSKDEILDGYKERLNKWVTEAHKNPLVVLNPIKFFEDLSPQSSNEPGKTKRIYIGRDKNGTAIYLKNPFGKIGEDLIDLYEQPYNLLKRKLSPFFGAVRDISNNDAGFGREVWAPDDSTLRAIGKSALHVFKKQVPYDLAEALIDTASGDTKDIQKYKAIMGIPLGLSFSKGYPGGPELGVLSEVERKRKRMKASNMPSIRKLIEKGEISSAMNKMIDLGFSEKEAESTFESTLAPYGKLSANRIERIMRNASKEDQEKLMTILKDKTYQ